MTRKPDVEVGPVPAQPALVAVMAQRVEGREAVAGHVRHTAPDTLAGLDLDLVPSGMTTLLPPAIGHIQRAPRGDHHRGGETVDDHHQGEVITEDPQEGEGATRDAPQEGVMRNDLHQGVVMKDNLHQVEVLRDDPPEGGVTRDNRQQGAVMGSDRHQRVVMRDDPLSKRSRAVQRAWLRNYWKHQLFSLCQTSLTWSLWLKLWHPPCWLSSPR